MLLAVSVQVCPRWESQAKFRHLADAYGASNFKVPSARRLAATLALRTCSTLSRMWLCCFRSTCVICSHRRVVRSNVSCGLLKRLQVGQCEVTETHGTSLGVVSAFAVPSAVDGLEWPRFGYRRRPRKCSISAHCGGHNRPFVPTPPTPADTWHGQFPAGKREMVEVCGHPVCPTCSTGGLRILSGRRRLTQGQTS